jgi:hypothetical protein
MLYAALSFWAFLPCSVVGKTSAQLCRGTSTMADDGNWYCSQVNAITYKNISQPGEYNRTTRVNPKTGLCEHEPVAYSGVSELTPLIGEVVEAVSMNYTSTLMGLTALDAPAGSDEHLPACSLHVARNVHLEAQRYQGSRE